MAKTIKIGINHFASNEEKDSQEWGDSVGRFIKEQWIDTGRYQEQEATYNENQGLFTNNVDTSKFKEILGMDDESWCALDWTYSSMIPKFVDVIADGYDPVLFKPRVEGTDDIIQKERKQKRETLEKQMLTKDFVRDFSNKIGIDFNSKNPIPESNAEIDFLMRRDYRSTAEIAAELVISNCCDINGYNEIARQLIVDLVVHSKAVTKTEYDSELGIKQRYVCPKRFIHSYSQDDLGDLRNCIYFGEVQTMTINDISKRSGDLFSEDELRMMASAQNATLSVSGYKNDDYLNVYVDVIGYAFKTTYNETYKLNKAGNLVPKEDTWQLHPDSRSKVLRSRYDVWYEGYYVIDANAGFGHHKMRDMIRPTENVNKSLPPYSAYETKEPSMVQRMKKYSDEIQLTTLQIQHLISQMKPGAISIDVSKMSDIVLPGGDVLGFDEAMSMLNQKGILPYASKDEEGNMNYNPPIQPIADNTGRDLQELTSYLMHNLQMMYNVTGVNMVRDGSSPQSGALVGTQRMALAMSNNATKHILTGYKSIFCGVSNSIISRVQQITMNKAINKNNVDLHNKIKNAIGRENADVLIEAYKLHEHTFTLSVEIDMDEEQRAQFEQHLLAAQQSNQITITDVIDIRKHTNFKLANEELKIKISKREKDMQQQKMQEMAYQNQLQTQQQITVEQARMGAAQAEIQAKQTISELELRKEATLRANEHEFLIMMENLKFQHEMQLRGMEVKANQELNSFKEKSKDKRTSIQATQQSNMINQRNKDLPPIDFEAQDAIRESYNQQPIPMMEEEDELGQQIEQESPELNVELPQE